MENSKIREEYIQNIPSISLKAQEDLAEKKVFIAGLKGLGGYVLEGLLRAGIGNITVMDKSSVEYWDVGRDILATDLNDGAPRANLARNRARSIDPKVNFNIAPQDKDLSALNDSAAQFDLVIDAMPGEADHKRIENICERAGIPMVYGGTSGWKTFVMAVTPGSGSVTRFYKNNTVPESRSVLSFTAAHCGALMAAAAVALLTGSECGCLDKIKFTDLSTMASTLTDPEERIFKDEMITIFVRQEVYPLVEERKVPVGTLVVDFMNSYEKEFTYFFLNEKILQEGDQFVPLEDGDILTPRKFVVGGV